MTFARVGKYRHYKGGIYDVIGIAGQTETGEELVVYRDVNGALWARPKLMFEESVEVDGVVKPRFDFVKPEEPGHVSR